MEDSPKPRANFGVLALEICLGFGAWDLGFRLDGDCDFV